jgi:AsmA protein
MKPSQLPWKWLLFGLIAVLPIGIAFIPWLIGDTTRLGDRVAARLSEWTEGNVAFTGPVQVSFFPDISVRGPLTVSGSKRLPFLKSMTVKEAKISLDLLELLAGNVGIDQLRLQKPRVTLNDDPDRQTPKSVLTNLRSGSPVRVLTIRNGRIDLAHRPITDLYLQLDAGEDSGALSGSGSFSFRGEPVRYRLETGAPRAADDAEQIPVSFTIASQPLRAKVKGKASFADQFQLDGGMKVESRNLRQFLTWIGFGLADGDSLKALRAAGAFHYAGGTLTFDDGTFSLDGNKATGALAVTASSHPRIEGTFAFDRLVLDPYLGTGPREAGSSPPANGASDLIFDRALLGYFDADLRISGAEIVAGPFTLGRGGFTITAKNGSVASEIGEVELCGGTAEGRVGVELAPETKELSLTADLADVSIDHCLAPFGLTTRMTGTGVLKADLTSHGNTLPEIASHLGGTVKLQVTDGSVPVDIGKLVANPTPLAASGWLGNAATSFDELKADCRLTAGQIWCQTLDIKTPRERVAGAGDIDLPRKTLNWNLTVAEPESQAGEAAAPSKVVPELSIKGPFSQPSIERTDHPATGASLPAGALEPETTPQ